MDNWTKTIEKVEGKITYLTQRQKDIDAKLSDLQKEAETIEKCRVIVRETANKVQRGTTGLITNIVNRVLSAVFEDPYHFDILVDTKRSKTSARLVFTRDGAEVDPLNAVGGGVVDVASFALRLAYLALRAKKVRKILILDEPFKMLSRQYHESIRQMIEILARELSLQILMVTHSPELEVGKVIQL